jgi:hypothetical protein
VLRSGATQRLGVLLHWYRGAVTRERLEIRERRRLRLAETTVEDLLRLEEDVVHEFSDDRPSAGALIAPGRKRSAP